VRVNNGCLKVGGDNDLYDVLLLLKVLAGMKAECISLDSDTDGNGKIGLEDAVHLLQVITGTDHR